MSEQVGAFKALKNTWNSLHAVTEVSACMGNLQVETDTYTYTYTHPVNEGSPFSNLL